MSYERYNGYRLAPDDNGCWDVLTDPGYEQQGTYPSKAAAKRAVDELAGSEPQLAHPKKSESEVMDILNDMYGKFMPGHEEAAQKIEALYNQRMEALQQAHIADLKEISEHGESGFVYARERVKELDRTRAGINKKEEV